MIGAPNSALFTAILLPLLIGLGHRFGLVDKPGGRKQHHGYVPLVGGIAIYAAVMMTELFTGGFAAPATVLFIIVAGLAVSAGMVDDLRPLPATAKLVGQFAIAALAVGCGGPTIGDPLVGLAFGWVDPVASALVYVAAMNAINLLDGADGVAGGVSAVVLCALILLAALIGARQADLAWIELGAVIGFLAFNMPLPWGRRPLAFLGDAGSMLIGFSLAWLALGLHRAAPQASPAALAWILALPVIDMGRVACGRLLRGKSPFTAGRDHLHHLMLDRGLSPLATMLAMVTASLGLGGIGVVGTALGLRDTALAAAFVIGAFAYVAAVEIWLAGNARVAATAYLAARAGETPDRLGRAA